MDYKLVNQEITHAEFSKKSRRNWKKYKCGVYSYCVLTISFNILIDIISLKMYFKFGFSSTFSSCS